jgi:protein tyrosine phosphatase (PTP) superfamily phosphohydrolase (DUF442 family)
MKIKTRLSLMGVLLLVASVHVSAAEVSEIDNYRQYSANFSSSGQPSAEQLRALSEAGFKRVIYLAFTDNKTAIESEDRVVKSLGMDYLHIPVDFERPTIEDFEDFAAVLNRDKSIRTLLHCQINLRASAFSFLYRVIYDGVPVSVAKSDLDAIWQPDRVWYQFVVEVMEAHGLSPLCEDCDWGSNAFTE